VLVTKEQLETILEVVNSHGKNKIEIDILSCSVIRFHVGAINGIETYYELKEEVTKEACGFETKFRKVSKAETITRLF